jgi:hypothetical protein
MAKTNGRGRAPRAVQRLLKEISMLSPDINIDFGRKDEADCLLDDGPNYLAYFK